MSEQIGKERHDFEADEEIMARVRRRIVGVLESHPAVWGRTRSEVVEAVKEILEEMSVPYTDLWVQEDRDRKDDKFFYRVSIKVPLSWPSTIGREGEYSISYWVPEIYEPDEHPY